MSTETLYSLAYGLVSACFVYPPTEFINAGLTVQALLSSILGSEQLDFITYHMRRTTATVLCHSALPIGQYSSFIFVMQRTFKFEALLCVTLLMYLLIFYHYSNVCWRSARVSSFISSFYCRDILLAVNNVFSERSVFQEPLISRVYHHTCLDWQYFVMHLCSFRHTVFTTIMIFSTQWTEGPRTNCYLWTTCCWTLSLKFFPAFPHGTCSLSDLRL